ncbi:MAG TPA: phosphoribosyl-ATP diphosphatase [Pseudomonadales bacterium]|nr:phosphoribosyl-ATP diphosphatase [Pseudomonadales bacterium]
MDVIEELTQTLEQRRTADPKSSYTASLFVAGLDRILKKVAEECGETIIAAKNVDAGTSKRDDALIGEVADLWFHTMVMLVHLGQRPAWVLDELARRQGISGHAEKAGRASQND